MMRKVKLIHANGKELGTKSVPEDCQALKYGGSTFVHAGTDPDGDGFSEYVMTNTYHFNNLD